MVGANYCCFLIRLLPIKCVLDKMKLLNKISPHFDTVRVYFFEKYYGICLLLKICLRHIINICQPENLWVVKQFEKYSSTACDKVIAQNIVMVNAGIYALTKLSKVTN